MASVTEMVSSLLTRRVIRSELTGQEYEIGIHLPHSYAFRPEQDYPVVYLLDGNLFGEMVAGTARLMAFSGAFPEVLVVSVGYPLSLHGEGFTRLIKLRGLELTPEPDAEFDGEHEKWLGVEGFRSGQAGPFRSFLLEELRPLVEREFRARPGERALVGHSASGLFTLYAMFCEPEAFGRYVVGSPPLGYGKGLMFRMEAEYAAGHKPLPARLFLGIGSEEKLLAPKLDAMVSVSGFYRFSALLESRSYEGFDFGSRVFEGFDHLSAPAAVFAAGLMTVFREDG